MTNWNEYIGVTNNLIRRVYEHKNKLIEGFTKKYNINKLVYYESCDSINYAIQREKEIKRWRREKKDKLVNSKNLKSLQGGRFLFRWRGIEMTYAFFFIILKIPNFINTK